MALPPPRSDLTALVTGASSGIGIEIARELARRGQNVTLVARSAGKLADLAKELRELGVEADVIPLDLADGEARAELADLVKAQGKVVSILVNNAGLSTMGPVHKANPQAELNMIELDVVAVAELCTRFLPGMVERRSGAVLNVASTAAFQPLPGQAGYAASKAFVLSYTRALSGELRGTHVTATALCPGPVRTGFNEAAGISDREAESAIPGFMWETAEDVARCGVDAMASGKTVVIPGLPGRLTAAFGHMAPKDLLMPILASRHPKLRK